MPDANLMEWDLAEGLPTELLRHKYDAIISTYALHHFSNEMKVHYITALLQQLTPAGKIFIGDIAFESRKQLEKAVKTVLIIGMMMNFILSMRKLAPY